MNNLLCWVENHLSYPHAHAVMVSVLVSGFLSSVVTAVITSLVCLVVRKRQMVRDAVNNISTPPLTPTCNTVTEITGKEHFNLKRNAAYTHVNVQSWKASIKGSVDDNEVFTLVYYFCTLGPQWTVVEQDNITCMLYLYTWFVLHNSNIICITT